MATETQRTNKIDLNIKRPNMYKVIFNNDEVTPAEFVANLLMAIFHHSEERAVEITQEVHLHGRGCAGIYTFEVAEQKGIEVTVSARAQGFPLQVKVEADA